MKRSELEHLIRAAGSIANDAEIVVIGSQAHDLAIAKHVAGREKDLEFTRELATHGMTDSQILFARLKETEVSKELRAIIEARIRRDATQGSKR